MVQKLQTHFISTISLLATMCFVTIQRVNSIVHGKKNFFADWKFHLGMDRDEKSLTHFCSNGIENVFIVKNDIEQWNSECSFW